MGTPGSQLTVQRLVDDNYDSLYRYAYRLSGTAADAEDLTQEAFCKAQARFGQLRDPGRVRPWLFSILRNAYLHRLRADRNARCVSLDDVGELPEPSAERRPTWTPSSCSRRSNELSELYRTPLILYYFDDFSYREIAEQMDLPIGTVMSKLARARRGSAPACCRRPTAGPVRRATDGL